MDEELNKIFNKIQDKVNNVSVSTEYPDCTDLLKKYLKNAGMEIVEYYEFMDNYENKYSTKTGKKVVFSDGSVGFLLSCNFRDHDCIYNFFEDELKKDTSEEAKVIAEKRQKAEDCFYSRSSFSGNICRLQECIKNKCELSDGKKIEDAIDKFYEVALSLENFFCGKDPRQDMSDKFGILCYRNEQLESLPRRTFYGKTISDRQREVMGKENIDISTWTGVNVNLTNIAASVKEKFDELVKILNSAQSVNVGTSIEP